MEGTGNPSRVSATQWDMFGGGAKVIRPEALEAKVQLEAPPLADNDAAVRSSTNTQKRGTPFVCLDFRQLPWLLQLILLPRTTNILLVPSCTLSLE